MDQTVTNIDARSGQRQQEPKQGGGGRRVLTMPIAATVVLSIGAAGLLWWLHARRFETTDDACMDDGVTNIALRAAGDVTPVPGCANITALAP